MTKKGDHDRGPVHGVHTADDLVAYSSRQHGSQWFVQRVRSENQQRAARQANVPLDRAWQQTNGDGGLIRWPHGTAPADLLSRWVPALRTELAATNARLVPAEQVQMRLAVAVGTSELAEGGLAGAVAVDVCRLVNAPQLREALANAPGCPLGVIVSDAVYQDVVASGVSNLDKADFRQVQVAFPDKGFTATAWITVPGDVKAGKDSVVVAAQEDGEGEDEEDARPSRRSKVLTAAAITASATVIGALIVASAPYISRAFDDPRTPGPSMSTTIPTTTVNTSTPASSSIASTKAPEGLREEIAGNRLGSPTYKSPAGVESDAGRIPFLTKVMVSCVAPNGTGSPSINALYRIETGRWKGLYSPANTFTNGDPPGEPGPTQVDPAVPACG